MSFYVKVKDSNGRYVYVEVSFEIHELFEEEKRYNNRITKRFERHGTDVEFVEDYMLPSRLHTTSIPQRIAYQEEINKAQAVIATCTEIQQRRFNLHRVMGYSLTEIAKMEGCSVMSIKRSVDAVSKKLEEIKSNF